MGNNLDTCNLPKPARTPEAPAVQHTPGPWKVVESGHKREFAFWIETEKTLCVGAVLNTGGSMEKMQANARLMAAAPELLEYLSGIVQAVERGELMVCDMNERANQEATTYLLKEARAAIAKATGGVT